MSNSKNTNAICIKSSKNEYRIDGFSSRFIELLDAIDFPLSGRYTYGASLCSVSVNTFRSWCLDDVAPKSFKDTENALEIILKFKGIKVSSVNKLMAWVLFGERIENPLLSMSISKSVES